MGRARHVGAVAALGMLLAASGTGMAAAPALIFTEYVEGAGHDKALEIANVGADAVDLDAADVRVEMYFNGKGEPDLVVKLHGRLEPGEVLVFLHQDADFVPTTGKVQVGGFGWFNGNDAIVLRGSRGMLDCLGRIGDDRVWGKDRVYRRRPDHRLPDADPYDEIAMDGEAPRGWTPHPKDAFDALGRWPD